MPRRAFARIGTDLHDEPSIRDLTAEQQWAYQLVLLRPDLSRCGVVAYTPRRWAKAAKNMTEKRLRSLFETLADRRHVILDEDTEEVLARTYVRHDGLLAQPNVVAAMVSDYQLISSEHVRTGFLAELRRMWDLDLPVNERGGWLLAMGHYPPASADSSLRFPDAMRPTALEALQRAIGTGLSVDMREAITEHSVRPFDEASPQGFPEPFAEGSRGRADAAPAPTPAPTPAPIAAATPAETGDGPAGHSGGIEDELLHELQTNLGPIPAITSNALRRHITTALRDGHSEAQVFAGLVEWRRRPGAKPGLLPHLIGDASRSTPDPFALDPEAAAYVAQLQAQAETRAARAGTR